MYNLVVCNLDNNVLTGTLDDFAFQTIANREDLHSRLRYLDLANNSFVGMHRFLASGRFFPIASEASTAVVFGPTAPLLLRTTSWLNKLRSKWLSELG